MQQLGSFRCFIMVLEQQWSYMAREEMIIPNLSIHLSLVSQTQCAGHTDHFLVVLCPFVVRLCGHFVSLSGHFVSFCSCCACLCIRFVSLCGHLIEFPTRNVNSHFIQRLWSRVPGPVAIRPIQ